MRIYFHQKKLILCVIMIMKAWKDIGKMPIRIHRLEYVMIKLDIFMNFD